MDNQQKIIKQFTPLSCPYCKKHFYVGSQQLVQTIISTPTPEEIIEVKNQIKERLNEITFANETDKKQIVDYLDDNQTILDFSDIEPVLKQIAMEQVEKLNNKTNGKPKKIPD